jgi:hypothetical protein
MDFFVRYPLAALVPALLFLIGWESVRRRAAFYAGLAWLLYTVYEVGMQRRWLCSGECNIRVDLIFVYAVLGLFSLAGIVAMASGAQKEGKS